MRRDRLFLAVALVVALAALAFVSCGGGGKAKKAAPAGGVFAYSGGAQYTIDSINTAPVVKLDESRAGSLMFRDHTRKAPYNLYAHVDQMYARCGEPKPPPPLFSYRRATAPVAGG